jgi:hypothetical protein
MHAQASRFVSSIDQRHGNTFCDMNDDLGHLGDLGRQSFTSSSTPLLPTKFSGCSCSCPVPAKSPIRKKSSIEQQHDAIFSYLENKF